MLMPLTAPLTVLNDHVSLRVQCTTKFAKKVKFFKINTAAVVIGTLFNFQQ